MKSSLINQTEKLIPLLSEKEKQEMAAYYTVYEKYADELSRKVTADLAGYPVFGKVTGGGLKEVAAADSKLLAAMQKDAIINGNWGHYIEYQTAHVTFSAAGGFAEIRREKGGIFGEEIWSGYGRDARTCGA